MTATGTASWRGAKSMPHPGSSTDHLRHSFHSVHCVHWGLRDTTSRTQGDGPTSRRNVGVPARLWWVSGGEWEDISVSETTPGKLGMGSSER